MNKKAINLFGTASLGVIFLLFATAIFANAFSRGEVWAELSVPNGDPLQGRQAIRDYG